MIGRPISHYRIEEKLGEGGMGVVYRAQDLELKRPVAVKFLSAGVADEQRRRRFQQEAQTASSLNHPHILTVFEAGTVEGQQYLVTEYVDGGTLGEWARREQPSVRQVVELITGVADGLATAHQAGILHRDIKPENILVSKNGYAKLSDFGLAKLLETAESTDPEGATRTAGTTKPGTILGTVAYMSPEQASGRKVDARSDVFSFGVVLYELFANRRPFAGTSDVDVMHAILYTTPAPLEASERLREVVEKALEKSPEDRYQSMREMVVDLRRVARARTVEVKPIEAPPAPFRRRRWLAPALAAMLLVGAAVGWWVRGSGDSGWRNPLEGARFTRLTDFEGVEADAVLSRDGNFVAFLSDRDGPMDVWILQIGSGQFLNLTKGTVPSLVGSQVRVLGFSADGSHVTLMTARTSPDGTRVFGTSIIPTIGGPTRLFLDGRVDPQWSPDGSRLLFFSLIQNRDIMYVADRDGANPREVFPEKPGTHNHFMGWSADGRYAAPGPLARPAPSLWPATMGNSPTLRSRLGAGRPEEGVDTGVSGNAEGEIEQEAQVEGEGPVAGGGGQVGVEGEVNGVAD